MRTVIPHVPCRRGQERKQHHGKAHGRRGPRRDREAAPDGVAGRADREQARETRLHHRPGDQEQEDRQQQGRAQDVERHMRALRLLPAHQGVPGRLRDEEALQELRLLRRGLRRLPAARLPPADVVAVRLQRLREGAELPAAEEVLHRRRSPGPLRGAASRAGACTPPTGSSSGSTRCSRGARARGSP